MTPFTPDPLVTLGEIEAFVSDVGLDDIDEDLLILNRDVATARIEDACGVAFTERETTEQATGRDGFALLAWPKVIQVVTVDGEAVGTGPFPTGRIPLESGDHSVVYRHGWQETPLPIKRAVLLMTRHYTLIDPTDFDERATSKSNEVASWTLVTPGVRGAIFPLPEVNQIVSDYAYATDVV